jgi:membrane protein
LDARPTRPKPAFPIASRRLIRLPELRRLAGRVWAESTTDHVSLAAAGCAFYATLALFPAISVLISAYGLIFNPHEVEAQLQLLTGLLPAPAYALIDERLHQLVDPSGGHLSIGLGISLVIAFWSSASGTKSIISALNVAYDVTERRSFLGFQLMGLAMTLLATVGAVLAIAVVVFLPPVIHAFGVSRHAASLIHWASMTVMVGFFTTAIALLYRFGPSRTVPDDPRILPGAIVATLLWLVASELLTMYVSGIGTFGATYGSLGAGVGVMLWFYVSAYAVLLGAEVNARLEDQAAQR